MGARTNYTKKKQVTKNNEQYFRVDIDIRFIIFEISCFDFYVDITGLSWFFVIYLEASY